MHVGSAAAEIRLQPEEIGFRSIGGPLASIDVTEHLIWLLIILMSPHVPGEGSRQRIVGDLLQAITEGRVTVNGRQVF